MKSREIRFFKSKVELRALTPEQIAAGYIGEMRGFIPYDSDSREMRDARGLAVFSEATVPPAPEFAEDARETRLRLLTA